MRRGGVRRKGLSGVALVAIAVLGISSVAHAFVVTFPDKNLEAAIRKAINLPAPASITDSDLLDPAFTALNASFRDIENLSGLEFCTNLTQLFLHGNRISDITPLASLTKLKDLYLWLNDISDISALENLADLRYVFLQDNNIQDISALNGQSGLGSGDVVNLSGNPINQDGLCEVVNGYLRPRGVTVYVTWECGTVVVNIPDANLETQLRRAILKFDGPVYDTDLLGLTTLNAPDAGIKDLTGLEYCTNLTNLNLAGNRIKDISILPRLSKLTYLYLGGNEISDLRPLMKSYGLVYLELQDQHSDNGVKVLSDLNGIQFLGGLQYLFVHDNALSDISKLGWLLNLHVLQIGNQARDLFIADKLNNTIRRMKQDGGVVTFAGQAGVSGDAEGLAAAARFNAPSSLVADKWANVYIADSGNNAIRFMTVAGQVSTYAGAQHREGQTRQAGTADGTIGDGGTARFRNPTALALDDSSPSAVAAGGFLIYVADTGNHTIRKIAPEDGKVTTLAGTAGTPGSTDGFGAAALFSSPSAIAVDASGNLYVADTGNHTIRKITPAGAVSTLAGRAGSPGSLDGNGSVARFNGPAGIAVDTDGTVYVADTNNHTIRSVAQDGTVATVAGAAGVAGSTDTATGPSSVARFKKPAGLSLDAFKNLYVADSGNHTVRKIAATGAVVTLAGAAGSVGTADAQNGPGADARFNGLTGLVPTRQISDIGILDGIQYLVSLDAGGNAISDLSPLSRQSTLYHLGLWDNKITSLTALSGLEQLTYLDVANNSISDIEPLVSMSSLTYLSLHDNRISNTGALAGLSNLAALYLQNNNISDISPLVANLGIGDPRPTGQTTPDQVDVRGNQLSKENLCHEVPALLARNVLLSFDGYCCDQSYTLVPKIKDPGSGSTDPGEAREFCPGSKVTITAKPAVGWEFVQWEGDISTTENPTTVVMTSDVHVTAVFRNTTITYSLDLAVGGDGTGGTVSPAGVTTYPSGDSVTIKATPASGYAFDHWDGSEQGTTAQLTFVMNAEKVIRGYFKKIVKYKLITAVSPSEGGTIDPPAGTYTRNEGEAVQVTAKANAGWAFYGWEGDLSGSANPNTIGMSGLDSEGKPIKRVTAVFKRKFAVTTTIVGQGSVRYNPPPTDGQFVDGTQVVVNAVPEIGWQFDHWEGALSGNITPATLVVTQAITVKAVFVEDGYDHTLAMVVETPGAGVTTPATGFHRFHDGDVVTVRAYPAPGYVFDHWAGDLEGEDTPATLTMDGDKTVRAVFVVAPVTYTLTLSVDGGGVVSPLAGTHVYAQGKKVTVVATPNLGWAFDHWEGAAGGASSVTYITMTTDKEATAFFRKSPVITALSPDRGLTTGEEHVLLLGLQLSTATSVMFGAREAAIVTVSDTVLEVLTPKGTPELPNARGSVDVVVKTSIGNATKLGAFTYIDPPGPPEVGSVLPTRGTALGGDLVLIRGRNLATAQAVAFGDTPAIIASSEDTRLYVATLPHEPGVVDVQVTTASGTATLSNAFTYVIKPEVLTVIPNQGIVAGGETVTIYGIGLANPTAVLLGGNPAVVASSNELQIELVTPAAAAPGPVEVSVTTSGGTATLLNGFDYFDGAASLACAVVDQKSGNPVTDASLRLEPLGRVVTENQNGVYTFINVRPDDYVLMVTAPSYAAQLKSVTLHRDENAQLTIAMQTAVGTPALCGSAAKRLEEKVAETTVPLSVQELPSSIVAPAGTLAIRLTSSEPVDPASAWAVLESNGGSVSDGAWRDASADHKDGWVYYTPKQPMPVGETVTLTVGAVTASGTILGPVSQSFYVSAAKGAEPAAPEIAEDASVAALPALLAAAKSPVYRIGPARVFAEPVAIQIPVPAGTDPASLEIYYYSESTLHTGWYLGGNVEGWIEPDSRKIVEAGGETFIEIHVNHAGVFQLGKSVKLALGNAASVDAGFRGTWTWAVSFAGVVLTLSLVLGALMRRAARG